MICSAREAHSFGSENSIFFFSARIRSGDLTGSLQEVCLRSSIWIWSRHRRGDGFLLSSEDGALPLREALTASSPVDRLNEFQSNCL